MDDKLKEKIVSLLCCVVLCWRCGWGHLFILLFQNVPQTCCNKRFLSWWAWSLPGWLHPLQGTKPEWMINDYVNEENWNASLACACDLYVQLTTGFGCCQWIKKITPHRGFIDEVFWQHWNKKITIKIKITNGSQSQDLNLTEHLQESFFHHHHQNTSWRNVTRWESRSINASNSSTVLTEQLTKALYGEFSFNFSPSAETRSINHPIRSQHVERDTWQCVGHVRHSSSKCTLETRTEAFSSVIVAGFSTL